MTLFLRGGGLVNFELGRRAFADITALPRRRQLVGSLKN